MMERVVLPLPDQHIRTGLTKAPPDRMIDLLEPQR
jgi:hypothetical protein